MTEDIEILGLRKKQPPATRSIVEAAEGVLIAASGTGLFTSLTQVNTMDLLSEGEIDGLVSGEWEYRGTIGKVGYDQAYFKPYNIPAGTSVRWLRSLFWDNVPVVNQEDQFNFQSVSTSMTPGYPNGAKIGTSADFMNSNLTVTRSIGERLRGGSSNAKIYRIFNRQANSCRVNVKVTQLSQSDKATGDINVSSIFYNIYVKPLFSSPGKTPSNYELSKREEIKGKISFGYIRSTLVELNDKFLAEPDFLGWEIKIDRETEESTTSFIRNITFIDSLTEIHADTFTYPAAAIVSSQFSAEYFSQVPGRAFDTKGIKVKIPSNYNPVLRTYGETRGGSLVSGGDPTVDGTTDVWDGNFKDDKQWTDNPAWCFYDILTNKRYGLGKYINESQVDKWTLFEVGKYCDTLVADGYGGLEPRFTCNLYLTSQDQAYKVVNDMASIFRAIAYYAGGTIYTVQDSEKDHDSFYLFTNANVENGNFLYSSSSRRVRHTTAIVRYNDKNEFYQPAVEYVENFDGIQKYGIREMEITAFGTTSRGQAVRLGNWALASENMETESVSFVAGMEGAYLKPGDVVKVFDRNRKTNRYAGRISGAWASAGNAVVTLDTEITGFVPTQQYQFSLLTPTYNYDPSQTTLDDSDDIVNIRRSQVQTRSFLGSETTVVGGKTRISFSSTFNSGDYMVSGQLVYALEASGSQVSPTGIPSGQFDYFRVLGVQEKEMGRYVVDCLQYAPAKFAALETGLRFQDPNVNRIPAGPTGLVLQFSPLSTENVKVIKYTFGNYDFTGVVGFKVFARIGSYAPADVSGSQYLINTLPPSIMTGLFVPSGDGTWNFRVYSFNREGNISVRPANNSIVVRGTNPLRDVVISSLKVRDDSSTGNLAGTTETGIYSKASPEFQWQVGYRQQISLPTNVMYRVTIREPSKTTDGKPSSAPARNVYHEVTGYVPEEKAFPRFTFDMGTNSDAVDSLRNRQGPFRDFDVVVEAHDGEGNSSAGGRFAGGGDSTFSNPFGYDIIFATNPPISGLQLTGTNPPQYADQRYITDQWITQDGDIRIVVTSGDIEDDIAGGYAYTSSKRFTKEEAIGTVPVVGKTIRRFQFLDSDQSQITIPAQLADQDSAFVAVSLYDTFDQGSIEEGNSVDKNLNISNVVQISKRGGTPKSATIRAWAEVGNSASDIVSAGFSKKEFLGTKTVFRTQRGLPVLIYRFELHFNTAFDNTNYSYWCYEQATATPVNERQYDKTEGMIPNVIKGTNSIVFEVPEGSRWFLGVVGT